jgi:hypothetical protein
MNVELGKFVFVKPLFIPWEGDSGLLVEEIDVTNPPPNTNLQIISGQRGAPMTLVLHHKRGGELIMIPISLTYQYCTDRVVIGRPVM